MTRDTEARRTDLRIRLEDAAEAAVARDGLAALRARDLAREAGCAVGAIYNAVADLDTLAVAVNARTFRRMGAFLKARAPDATAAPRDRLVALSHAYLAFAATNPHLWRALFALSQDAEARVPDWYRTELDGLFALIAGPLGAAFPDWPTERVDLLTRTLFSSVHGIAMLGLDRRISAVPAAHLEAMIALLIGHVLGD